ncbi:MAG TPA: hypothetical protein VFA60_16115 [Terriglobales bacterium]|nr:hypothetical protein [Terriglobales bacterium]
MRARLFPLVVIVAVSSILFAFAQEKPKADTQQPKPAAQQQPEQKWKAAAAEEKKAAQPEGRAKETPESAGSAGEAPATTAEEKAFRALTWRQIGPFRGGRALAVAGVPSQPNVYYFGAVAGGVWKSTDGGLRWTPVFDKVRGVSSIGSIAVAESDPNVIYVGTGEACIRGNIVAGNGVYKSMDAGKTWSHVGLDDTQTIGRVIVHPRDPNTVFVAAMGHVYGQNVNRGVFRSVDGGKSWQKVLYKDDKTGAIDITFDPTNANTLFASLWEAHRTPWSMESGGPGSGLYKSTDGGSTWKQITGGGLPKTILGRIGVSVSGTNPNRVYALVEAENGGVFRSDDGGENWRLMNDERRLRQRAWYYTHIFADPKNPDTVYVLNTSMYRSNDGGRTFTPVPAPHGDHHGLWIDPNNPQRMINSNDGGANVSVNGGATWTGQDNQPTAQFYHVITDNRWPYWVYGAQQDNTTVAIASRSDSGVIGRADYYDVGGGESGYIAPDPNDPENIIYAGSYGGLITRLDRRTGQEQQVNPWPDNPMGHGASDLKYRFQWTAPIIISRHDANVIYHAANVLFKSTDKGMSWTAISPDLTRNDKSKQQPSGGPITKDNTSVEYYDTIFSVAESPKEKDLIWVGTDDGLVQITRDAGKTWTNVTPKDMPEWGRVNMVEASPHEAGVAYVAVDRHEMDDWAPYIFKTGDYGKSWSKVTTGIPQGAVLHAVREDPVRRGLLYAGTESGLYVSWDDGAHWQPWLQRNLPTTPVHDLVVKDAALVVGTHGRSFWILDDLSPVRQFSGDPASQETKLYAPAVAYRLRGPGFEIPVTAPAGQNPPTGAWIYYQLKVAPKEKEEITLEIMDGQGKRVRRFSNIQRPEDVDPNDAETPPEFRRGAANRLAAEPGLDRFVWNLRVDDAPRVPNSPLWAGSVAGPQVLPGTYQLKLTVAGKTYTQPLEIRTDPRVKTPLADLQKQFELRSQIHQKLTQVHEAVNQIRSVRKQIEELNRHVEKSEGAKAIAEAGKKLNEKMSLIEEELIQVKSRSSQDPLNFPIKLNNRLAALAGVVESADTAPTKQSYEVFEMLSHESDEQLAKWKQVLASDVPAFNDLVRQQNVPAVSVQAGAAGTQ